MTQTHHDQVTYGDRRSTVTRTHRKSVRERGMSKRGQGQEGWREEEIERTRLRRQNHV